MCKHCNIDGLNVDYIADKKRVLKIGKTPVADEFVSVEMRRNDDKKQWTLEFEHAVFGNDDRHADVLATRTVIKYCPFCGDKLADKFDKE